MADKEDTSATKHAEDEAVSFELPIKYYGTENVVSILADQAMVSHSTGLFTLYFFQMQIPPSEKVEDYQKLTEVPAQCVARIVVTPPLLQQFIEAIAKNMEKYKRLVDLQVKKVEN